MFSWMLLGNVSRGDAVIFKDTFIDIVLKLLYIHITILITVLTILFCFQSQIQDVSHFPLRLCNKFLYSELNMETECFLYIT